MRLQQNLLLQYAALKAVLLPVPNLKLYIAFRGGGAGVEDQYLDTLC